MKASTRYECVKCRNDPRGGSVYISGQQAHYLCKGCHAIVQDQPTHDVIYNFLKGYLNLSDEQNAMIKARRRRNRGKSPWNKLNKDGDDKVELF